jgi:prepilin-type N-terminal cleavage/methylation domain-containing protein
MRQSYGFSLIEVTVTVVIVGIFSLMAARAYPVWRERQHIIEARQVIQSELRAAQQQAIQEIRSPDCLAGAATYDEERHCSDIGLWFEAGQSSITVYADTAESDSNTYNTGDYVIKTLSLPGGLRVKENKSFLFEAVPPSVTLFHPGSLVLTSGGASVNDIAFNIGPYGQVEE